MRVHNGRERCLPPSARDGLVAVVKVSARVHTPAEARKLTRSFASEVGYPSVLDLELVVSELVTNAIAHGSPPVELRLTRRSGKIRGEVSDASTAPIAPNPRPDERGGFGLIVVAKCASRWGVEAKAGRKMVWFEFD